MKGWKVSASDGRRGWRECGVGKWLCGGQRGGRRHRVPQPGLVCGAREAMLRSQYNGVKTPAPGTLDGRGHLTGEGRPRDFRESKFLVATPQQVVAKWGPGRRR